MSVDPDLFPVEEYRATEVLSGLDRYTICVNDPPWSAISESIPIPERVILAWDMDVNHLESLLAEEPDSETVVGFGGGSAMDTAKFVAWRTGKKLIQIPTITSVDAGFTDAIGARMNQKVNYLGEIFPDFVVLDVELIRSAPRRLNRAGVGDVLSCHTGLYDWRIATDRAQGAVWDEELAQLGRSLLDELAEMVDDIWEVSEDAIRWLVSAYRRIGAASHHARHSRFEEGSEHFLGYCYEHLTGTHQTHGELISMCTMAMSALQDNEPQLVNSIIRRSGVRAHPADLGIDSETFFTALLELPTYVRDEQLDFSIVDIAAIDEATANLLWGAISELPRVASA